MAAQHGRNTTILWNALDASGYLANTDYSLDTDTSDVTTYGKRFKEHVAGMTGATVTFEGVFDGAAGNAIEGQLRTDNGVLTYCPTAGAAIGDRAKLLAVTGTSYTESSPIGGAVRFGWNVISEDSVGIGVILHPLSEDTNTTTGAERDDTAATSTGWVAHLHVIAVDAGSWVIKLQDAAVSNTYSDVTGGAFTAATGATYQRLEAASTTTQLRRYVRYVATRTGGTAGDGITFGLAYARNL